MSELYKSLVQPWAILGMAGLVAAALWLRHLYGAYFGGATGRKALAMRLSGAEGVRLGFLWRLRALLGLADLLYAGIDRSGAPDAGGGKGLFFTEPETEGRFWTRRRASQPFLVSYALGLGGALFSFLFGWAFLGGLGGLGALEILRPGLSFPQRALTVFLMLLWPFFWVRLVQGLTRLAARVSEGSIFPQNEASWAKESIGRAALGFAFVVGVVGALAVAGVVAIGGSMAVANAFGVAFAGLIAFGGAAGAAAAGAVAVSGGGLIVVVLAFTLCLAFSFSVGGVALGIGHAVKGASLLSPEVAAVLAFIWLAPLAKAVTGWLLYGASRGLLRRVAARGERAGWLFIVAMGMIEGALGILGLLGFIALFIGGAEALKSAGADLDWRPMALAARDHPWTQGFNASLMLFAFFIPTLLYVAALMEALIMRCAGASRAGLLALEGPEGPEWKERFAFTLGLALRMGAALAASGLILWLLLRLWGISTESGSLAGALHDFALCAADRPGFGCLKALSPGG